jgi:hypothetical protein
MVVLIWFSFTDKTTWSPTINALVEKGTVDVMPYDLVLDYEYLSYGIRFNTCAWRLVVHEV